MSEIPRVLHQFWMGSPVPAWARHLHERILRLNPGWTGRIWTEADLDEIGLVNRAEFAEVKGMPFKSDVVRYELVARFGGVYADLDIVWVRPLESVVNLAFDFIAHERREVLNNGIFGCRRGSPFAWDLVRLLPDAFKRERELGGLAHQTGVGYFRTVAERHPGLARLPQQFFHPYGIQDFAGRDACFYSHPVAVGIHFFNSNNFAAKVERLIREGRI